MDLKEEIRSLLQKGYSAINDLNKTADMTPKHSLLKKNGLNAERQAKEFIRELHGLVEVFGTHLQNVLQKTVDEKVKTLKRHSEEIIQCVEYVSNICLAAENIFKDNNLQAVNSLGPTLKAEFLKSLGDCRELKMVDYETFTSVDIEVNLNGIFQLPLVNIISWNHLCLKKQIIHSLGFGSIEKDNLPLSLSNLNANVCHSDDSEMELSDHSSMRSHKDNTQTEKLIHQNFYSVDIQTIGLKSVYDKVPCTGKTDLQMRNKADMAHAEEPKTRLLHQQMSYGDLNSQHPLSRSTIEKPSSSLSQSNRSLGHVQNPTYSTSKHLAEISVPVVSSTSSNIKITRESAPVIQAIKEETPDDNISEIESALQLSLSLRDDRTAVEQKKEFSKAGLTSRKTESEMLPPEGLDSSKGKLTLASSPDSTTQPPGCHSETAAAAGKVKGETKESSCGSLRSYSSFRIEPLKMTFDLRAVMHSQNSGILARHIETIDGGSSTSFNHPVGVTVSVDGHVVIADTGNHVVKVLQNNTLLFTIGHNDGVLFVRPSAVVTDSQGNIYVKDDRCIQIFDRSGNLLDTVGKSRFNHPYGLALATFQNEPILVGIDVIQGKTVVYNYFLNDRRLESYTYGPTEEFQSPFSKLRFLAVYEDVMLVSDLGASCLHLSFLNGQRWKSFGCLGNHVGHVNQPSGIAVDASGNWIVGDSKNNRLQAYTNDGSILTVIPLSTPIRRPSGIHLTSDGLLYVINYLDSVIKVYDLCH